MKSLAALIALMLFLGTSPSVYAVDANTWLIDQMNSQLKSKTGSLSKALKSQGKDPATFVVDRIDYKWNWKSTNYTLEQSIETPMNLGSASNYRCQPYTKSKADLTIQTETTRSLAIGVSSTVSESFNNTNVIDTTVEASYGTANFKTEMTNTWSTDTSSLEENNQQTQSTQTTRCEINQTLSSEQTPSYAYLKNTTQAIMYKDAKTNTDNIQFSYDVRPETIQLDGANNETTTVYLREVKDWGKVRVVIHGNKCSKGGGVFGNWVSNGQSDNRGGVQSNKNKDGEWTYRCHNFQVDGGADHSGSLTVKNKGSGGTYKVYFNQSSVWVVNTGTNREVDRKNIGTGNGRIFDCREFKDLQHDDCYIESFEITNKGGTASTPVFNHNIYDSGNGIFSTIEDMSYHIEGTQKASSNDVATQCQIVILTWDSPEDRDAIASICNLSESQYPPETDGSQINASLSKSEREGHVNNRLDETEPFEGQIVNRVDK